MKNLCALIIILFGSGFASVSAKSISAETEFENNFISAAYTGNFFEESSGFDSRNSNPLPGTELGSSSAEASKVETLKKKKKKKKRKKIRGPRR